MRDYLSELAAKNIGTANVVEPRRAARFESAQTKNTSGMEIEPPPPSPSSAPRTRGRVLYSGEKDEIISRQNDSDEQIARTSFVSSPETLSTGNGQNDARLFITPKAFESAREKAANESLSVPNRTSSESLSLLASMPPPLESAESRKKSDGLTEPAPTRTLREPKAEADEPKTSSPEDFRKQNIEERASIVVKPRVEKISNRAAETAIRQTANPTPLAPSSKQIQEHAETRETPTINVTIGRIEIRAVASSSPPPKETTPAAKPPTLSLDEFLRKRRAGGNER